MPWRDPRSIGRHGSAFAALRADLAADVLAAARQAGLYFFISLLVRFSVVEKEEASADRKARDAILAYAPVALVGTLMDRTKHADLPHRGAENGASRVINHEGPR